MDPADVHDCPQCDWILKARTVRHQQDGDLVPNAAPSHATKTRRAPAGSIALTRSTACPSVAAGDTSAKRMRSTMALSLAVG